MRQLKKELDSYKKYELYKNYYSKLRLIYGTWQSSYREAFLRDKDNMECLEVEDFYRCLDSAW